MTLWRSRRGGGLIRRYIRRALLAVGALLVLYFGLYPLAESYVLTHAARAYVPTPELGAAFEEVSFTTSDGLRLEGWYMPSENGAAIISFPGRKGPQKPARMLAQHGYGVLLFDRRGEGESEGIRTRSAGEARATCRRRSRYLQSRPDVDPNRIGGVGLSVGGEVMLQAAAETDSLAAIVSEGAGMRSVREAVHMPGSVKVIVTEVFGVVTLGTSIFASDLPPPSLTDLSADISEPLFVIYSDPGQGGEILSRQYYDAAKGPKEVWEAPGDHIGAFDAAPEEYERRVVGFFDRSLLETEGGAP